MELVVTDAATAALNALGAKLDHLQPVNEAAAMSIATLATRSFNDASVRAAPWAPLKAATVAAKLREGTSTAILKRHGLLWQSFKPSATDEAGRVTTDRPYAGYHQFGTSGHTPTPAEKQSLVSAGLYKEGMTTGGKVPPRPMLPITGVPPNVQLTPLAAKRMLSAAQKALRKLTNLPGA